MVLLRSKNKLVIAGKNQNGKTVYAIETKGRRPKNLIDTFYDNNKQQTKSLKSTKKKCPQNHHHQQQQQWLLFHTIISHIEGP